MSDDEATRPHPDRGHGRAPRRLRWWQRGGVHTATANDDVVGVWEGGAGASGPYRSIRESSPFRLRALEQPDPAVGAEIDSRACARVAACRGREPAEAGRSSSDAQQPAPDPLVSAGPLVRTRDCDRSRSTARAAFSTERDADRSCDETERARPVRASTGRGQRSFHRLEGCSPAIRACTSIAVAVVALLVVGSAEPGSPPPVQIGISSQQAGPSRAIVRARIAVRDSEPGHGTTRGSESAARLVRLPVKGGATNDGPEVEPYPPLRSDSALAQNPRPFGPGSFWYPVGPGRTCIYAPGSVLPCYTLVGPGGTPGGPALDPGAIAAAVADRLPLLPGRVQTSPRSTGLTGTDSWFWLDPSPRTVELSVVLAGETVTVTAEPSAVDWRFGDGIDLVAGPGRPYRVGPPPADAVVHSYETRCLPGDQGRNPYVLGSCGSTGYDVEAVVVWRISYSASGPVDASGTLPTRSTATSIAYPVSEARGFLVPGATP